VANAGYRRFLAAPTGKGFAIDPDKVAVDAQFDGVFMLRTNMKVLALRSAVCAKGPRSGMRTPRCAQRRTSILVINIPMAKDTAIEAIGR
jgi:hypothetical protein